MSSSCDQTCRRKRNPNRRKLKWKSACLKYEEERENKAIVTLCKAVDVLLGNGVRPGLITEVLGLPGVGKTTFCIQLCLTVQIPEFLKGHGGQAIYLATDHSLSVNRLSQMAAEFIKRGNRIISGSTEEVPLLTLENVMSGIHIAKCFDMDELIRLLLSLDSFLEKNKVRLIVIDSIAFPMYTEADGNVYRGKILCGIYQILYRIIQKYEVAIIITNNMATRFADNESKYHGPFLGEDWAHIPNQRLILSCAPGNSSRMAQLMKSNCLPKGSARYRIVHAGFRD